jgi:hypothetical protein
VVEEERALIQIMVAKVVEVMEEPLLLEEPQILAAAVVVEVMLMLAEQAADLVL